jgi:hypothetical protein
LVKCEAIRYDKVHFMNNAPCLPESRLFVLSTTHKLFYFDKKYIHY